MFWKRKKKTSSHAEIKKSPPNSASTLIPPFKERKQAPRLNESIYHAEMKSKIGKLLQRTTSNLNIKEEVYTFDKSRKMDLFGFIAGKYFCIEAQVSLLNPEELLQRTINYSNQGIYVLWILHTFPNYLSSFCLYELQKNLQKSQKFLRRKEKALPAKTFWKYSYNTTAVERFLHALYGGKTYYFLDNQIIPVHYLKLYQVKYTFEGNKPYRKYYRKRRVPITQGSLESYNLGFWSSTFKSQFFGSQFQQYNGQRVLLAKFADNSFWP